MYEWQMHSDRVAKYVSQLYKILFPMSGAQEQNDVFLAALFHDIGKENMPEDILNKPGKLTESEYSIIKQHTCVPQDALLHYSDSFNASESELILMAIHEHHERYDGLGYPLGISKNNISLVGRICAIADTFDAITSDRVYQKRRSNTEAFHILSDEAGRQFDPDIISVALKDKSWARIGELEAS